MYLEHFGLALNPFGLSPKLDFLYKSETFEESMAHLIYGLDNQEAIILITGAIGTGKTMALQSFLMNLGPRFEFALLTNTRLSAIEMLKLTLEDLGVKYSLGSDKSDLLILFKDFLLEASKAGKRVLIVVDEAQNLSPEVLEEIRLLTNLGQGESQPVTIILVGQPELETMVNRPDLAQLRQRIRVHYNLDPLSRKEIEEYIDHRMAVAGCTRKVFTGGAFDTIFHSTRGVPRLVNTLASEALLSAFVAGNDKVQSEDVEKDQELSFETGPSPVKVSPVPVPEPSPEVAPPELMAPPVAPRPDPVSPPPSGPTYTPEVDIPSRKSDGSTWKLIRGWVVAAILVLALGGLYFMGVLDGVIKAINPEYPPEVKQTAVARDIPNDQTVLEVEPVVEELAVEAPNEESEPATMPAMPDQETAAEATSQAPAEEIESPEKANQGNSYIHVSSFRAPDRAYSLVKRLVDVGPGGEVVSMEVRGEKWYRVYLGPYASRDDAYLEALRLKESGTISYFRLTTLNSEQINQP